MSSIVNHGMEESTVTYVTEISQLDANTAVTNIETASKISCVAQRSLSVIKKYKLISNFLLNFYYLENAGKKIRFFNKKSAICSIKVQSLILAKDKNMVSDNGEINLNQLKTYSKKFGFRLFASGARYTAAFLLLTATLGAALKPVTIKQKQADVKQEENFEENSQLSNPDGTPR